MDKVLVEVFVPAARQTYDIFIPRTSKMSEVVMLVSRAIDKLSGGKYKVGFSAVLCDAETGNIFNINLSVYELKIQNGSKLILI